MKNPILVPELRELLKRKRFSILQSFMEEGHAREIAEYVTMLSPDEIWKLLNLVDKHRMVDIFSYLDMDVQVEMASGSTKKNITQLLKEMSHDDRADLFQHLDRDIADRLLVLLPVVERADIIKLTSYREETAGAIMTTDFITLNENDTVEKSIRKIRREAPSKETIYYVYVIDNDRRLIGFISLRKIILSQPKQKIGDIMKREVIYAHVSDDQESAARLIDEYDLIALPIVDAGERLAGIITYDDAIDIIREEQTEDMEKLMAISGGVEDRSYLDLPAHVHFKKRVFWVVILGMFGLVTGSSSSISRRPWKP
jgi:magnesium transporter